MFKNVCICFTQTDKTIEKYAIGEEVIEDLIQMINNSRLFDDDNRLIEEKQWTLVQNMFIVCVAGTEDWEGMGDIVGTVDTSLFRFRLSSSKSFELYMFWLSMTNTEYWRESLKRRSVPNL